MTLQQQNADAAVEMFSVSCAQCGSETTRTLYEPWNTEVDPRTVLSASGGVRGTQRIVQCTQCGLMYANPRPKPTVVVDSYATAVDEVYVGAAASRERTFKDAVKLIERYAQRGKLLDVGAAAGFFVKAACDAGWDAIGVEPCRWLAEYGQQKLGVTVHPQTLGEARFPDASFDVVSMWDVLEHVPDPLSEVREVFRILKPGGLYLVNFPDAGTWQAKMAGKNWWFFLSNHLTYFTPATLQNMLKSAGFGQFVTRAHYQTLELGHLMKMFAIYSKGFSSFGGKIVHGLHMDNLPIRYYASQTNVICRKPAG